MKKLILLLLISGGLSAQVVVPKSTTTFSNIVATGSETVTGNLKVGGAITSPTVYGSSAAGGTINVFGTSNASGGVVNISKSTGTTQINSLTNITNSTTIGTGTVAANTSSLGIVRIKQGSSFWDIGDYGTGYAGLWANQSIPTTTNYAIASSTNSLEFLNPTSINMNIAGTTKFFVTTGYCYARNLLRVGTNTVPSATLDVTGTMSVSGTSTLTGAAKQTNTLNYEGNTTWNTNQTNTLTTGNTGTVAVLSNVYALYPFLGGSINPIDGQTFYCGTLKYAMSSNRTGGFYIPYNATIVGWISTNIVSGLASNETYSLQCWQNNTTATNLSTTIVSTSAVNTFSGTANITVTAGDYIETRFIGAAWGTNPIGLEASVSLLISPR